MFFAVLMFRLTLAAGLFVAGHSAPHEGPDPVAHWVFDQRYCHDGTLRARLGPDGIFTGMPRWDESGRMVHLDGRTQIVIPAAGAGGSSPLFSRRDLTVTAIVALDDGATPCSIVGNLVESADGAAGWRLGFDGQVFTFELASADEQAPTGQITRLVGKTPIVGGSICHVAGVFDGRTVELYVDGVLQASSSGKGAVIAGDCSSPILIGGAGAGADSGFLRGQLREIAVYGLAARAPWVASAAWKAVNRPAATQLPAVQSPRLVVQPFLQFATQTGIRVVCQLDRTSPATLHWGETAECPQRIESTSDSDIHEFQIEGLQPEAQFFYRVSAPGGADGELTSAVSTFQTASRPGTPIAFAVIGDTQERPHISGPLAGLAWTQRPNFVVLAGDLVDKGPRNSDWTEQFFPSMSPLISRVPLFPVLGNHEENADNYYRYMSLPPPEYYYSFSYGDADFFMIDSNRKVGPGSEQYEWLDRALGSSTAIWKFVCHHHPPYSSDENDYGDLWKTSRSTRGDLRVRKLVPLYEKHHVDIVWTGHIHSYERTWPIRENAAVESGGVIYVVTGGGGGGLETAGPYRPFFQNSVRHGHHYCFVAIHRGTLEFRAFTIDDRLFDTFRIDKPF